MLRYSLLFFLFFSLSFALETPSQKQTYEQQVFDYFFKRGVHDYKIGSYYNALDEFAYLAKRPENPYYLPALKYLAKTYLQIGKRTGQKRYLWNALDYLNIYLARGGKENSDFYITKGLIYEILGFYERATTYYKIALEKATNKSERIMATIGLLRAAVWSRSLDLATKYILMLNIETLSDEQKKELLFLKGMYDFMKEDYAHAITSFEKSYRQNESFLIENPEYYYIVAETAYRIGDLGFAQRLFRRILNYVKNRSVIQKSLLRLGDINFLLNQFRESANFYFRLIKDFPKSKYATIAKLKILYLMQKDRKLAYYVKKFLPNAPFLHDPQKFVTTVLVKNRNSYVGLFALANFGLMVFDLGSEKLMKRLSWELSIVSPEMLKYEHKEYFHRLWGERIKELTPKDLCLLYKSNPSFFFAVFTKKELDTVAQKIKQCHNEQMYLDFLKLFVQKYKDDAIYYKIVRTLFYQKRYQEAQKYLEYIQKRDCTYRLWNLRIKVLAHQDAKADMKRYLQMCHNPFYVALVKNLYQQTDRIDFLLKEPDRFVREYNDDPLVRYYVESVVEHLLQKGAYQKVIEIVNPIVQKVANACHLKSILALSYVRVAKIELARSILQDIQKCQDTWYLIATNAIKDFELQERVRNVGKNR